MGKLLRYGVFRLEVIIKVIVQEVIQVISQDGQMILHRLKILVLVNTMTFIQILLLTTRAIGE